MIAGGLELTLYGGKKRVIYSVSGSRTFERFFEYFYVLHLVEAKNLPDECLDNF